MTGGCGFVGRHLVDALVRRGDRVVVADIAERAHRPDVEFLRTDITDEAEVRRACEGADTVFHNASLVHTRQTHADRVHAVNLGGTRQVIAACLHLGVGKLVYVSSASVVYAGRDIEGGDETLPTSSISQAPYADSKIAAERLVLAADGEGLSTCAIRPHVVFGPGDTRFVPAILARAKAGRLRYAVGRRRKLSDFTYVDNLVDALLAADEHLGPGSAARGQAYFVTNGEPIGFWEFVSRLLARLGYPPIRHSIPFPIAYAGATVAETIERLRGGEVGSENGYTRFAIRYMCTHHYFRIEKARRDLGWQPRVDLATGIERTAVFLESGRLL